MKARLLALTGLRIVSLYLFVRAFNFITYVPLFFQGRIDRAAALQIIMLIVMPFLFSVAVGVFLWITADTLARYMLPGCYAEATIPELSDTALAVTAFTVLGFVVLAFAVPGLMHNLTNYLLIRWWRLESTYSLGNIAEAVRNSTQLAFGLALVLGGRRLAERLHNQTGGRF